MNDKQIKDLCLALMRADTEEDVIDLLKRTGYWNNQGAWRYYGDTDSNSSMIGSQANHPDAALVEKLVNSADHRLLNECLVRGIDPEGTNAPRSIRQAVAQFFDEEANPNGASAGRISEWGSEKRREIAEGITLAATGFTARNGNPCFTISDCGEGQTPEMMPKTFLSLPTHGSNKIKIPFVQGKFNMGSTGALPFCGRHKLQLIVSRRNPAILNGNFAHESDDQWSFTVVRREAPEGSGRGSVWTYLAPLEAEEKPRQGGVLRFSADELPIFPEVGDAYARKSAWGTLVKLYEYSTVGYSGTHILRKDGLLSRLDLLLPDAALPIRLYECRSGYKGHEGSFANNLTGLNVRLEDNTAENIEEGFPTSTPISALGQQMTATIYAFKKGKADTYRKNEGIIFTLNGQTHSHLTKAFFTRKAVGRLNRIADSILVTVDCSEFDALAREDFFMNSRDRLRYGELSAQIESELEELLKTHEGLRALKDRRHQEEIASKVEDSKPLEDVLKSLIKQSPVLAALFLQGNRISNPFKPTQVVIREEPYKGEYYPTYFKFKGKDYGTELHRDCHINQRCRITFETDAANDYFKRRIDKGESELFLQDGNSRSLVETFVGPHPNNGIATLSIRLPDNCHEGDTLRYMLQVTDPSRVDPFENPFTIRVIKAAEPHKGGNGEPPKPPTQQNGKDREVPSGINLPPIHEVYEGDWREHKFDKYSALRVVTDENDRGEDIRDFYVNMDNIYLKTELKSSGQDVEVIKARWRFGLVLLGLAVLHQDAQSRKVEHNDKGVASKEKGLESKDDKESDDDKIGYFSKAVAPFLLPIINSLGTLDAESILTVDDSGEAT